MTMVLPAYSGRAATLSAAARLAPVEMPPGMPSTLARRRDVSKAVSFDTVDHLVDELGIEDRGDEACADALNLVGPFDLWTAPGLPRARRQST